MNRIARYFAPQTDDMVSYHGDIVPSDDTTPTFTFDGPIDPAAGLQWNMTRHFDPTVGEWMSEDPVGFAGDDENVRKYPGQH